MKARLYKREKIWHASIYHEGKEHRFSTKKLKKFQAQEILDKRIKELKARRPGEGEVVFRDLARSYINRCERKQLRSTYMARIHVKHLLEFFGEHFKPRRMSVHDIERYQEHRFAKVSGSTVNRETAALRRMYKAGLKGFIPEFPDPFPEPPARKGFMEHENYLAIRAELEPDLQDVLDFGYWSGWRRGEVLGLEWSEVDLDAGEIRLPPERSKNKAGRTLPIPAPIMEVLERRAKLRHLNMRYVFHVNGEAIGKYQFYRRWKNAAKASGLPAKLFHDLRRTVARNLIRAGVNEKVAMEWTGHKTASVFRTYNIVSKSDLEEAAVKLVAHVTNQPPTVAQFAEAKEKRK